MLTSFGIRFFIQLALSPFSRETFLSWEHNHENKDILSLHYCIWKVPLATDCRLYVSSICCRFPIDTPHTPEMGRNQRSNTLTILQTHISTADHDILMLSEQKTSIHGRHTHITDSSKCHRTPLVIKQNWLRSRLGTARQHTTGWDNVDPALRRHVTLGHYELSII